MQSRRVRILGAAACTAAVFTLSATAGEPVGTTADVTILNASAVAPAAVSAGPLSFDPPVPIGANAKLHRVLVTKQRDGTIVQYDGAVSQGAVDCLDAPDSVYCNTAGAFIFGLSGTSATSRFADDIVTSSDTGVFEAAPAPPPLGCFLDRYVIRVTGDKNQDGSGIALGEYTVNYALYDSCPGANTDARVIPGTEGSTTIPAAQAGDIVEVTKQIQSFEQVFLPSNEVFLGISFSRKKCGSVVGAPALKGFSGDQLDLPGTSCSAALGVFPGSAQASFYAEIYVRPGCGETFIGYRNSNQGRAAFSEGSGVRFADDIVPPIDCNLVAYEFAFREAIVEVDIRSDLSPTDPDNGFVLAGTRDQFSPCFGCVVQIGHVDVDPPQHLVGGLRYWVAFKSGSSSNGPVRTCKPALIGDTSDLHSVYNSSQNQWEVRTQEDNCWDAFDVTLFCEGAAPSGACCDMALTECVGGPNDGEPCSNNVRCAPGSCESVCRDVPRTNCTADAVNAPLLWREGKTCGPVCTSGAAFGQDCVVDADCVVCDGGARGGQQCCPGGTCNSLTDVCRAHPQQSCTSDADCFFCVGGAFDTQICSGDAECPGGTCDTSDTCNLVPTCASGVRDGMECCPLGTCRDGACDGPICSGGSRNGQPCTREADCPGGTCANSPFLQSCGVAACCQPGDITGQDRAVCEDFTLNECNAVPPQGAPRRFQIGKSCSDQGQACPLVACLVRSGDCTLEQQAICKGGEADGRDCEIFAFPSECTTNFNLGIACGGECVGGTSDGEFCDPNQNNTCDGGLCPGGTCVPGICQGRPGCENDFCCTDVCESPNMFSCCEIHWDALCATQALAICDRVKPSNDECFDSRPGKGAIALRIPDTIEGDSINATNGLDPGFCCHKQNPGGPGVGSLWYKFVATETSAKISTCQSVSRIGADGKSYRAEDSLIAVYSVGDPTRGICNDLNICDVSLQNCDDGSECVPDEQAACETLSPVACNDDDDSCNSPRRSGLCVSNLVPGQLYYLQVAGKSNEPDLDNPNIIRGNGVWKINITAPCSSRSAPLTNDACADAQPLTGGDVEPLAIPFDLSGQKIGVCDNGDKCTVGVPFACLDGSGCRVQDAATFDCPGPPLACDFGTIKNDIWYDWIAPITGEATIDTCGVDPNTGSQSQTGLVVYDGCECPADDARIALQTPFLAGIPGPLACSWLAPPPCLGGSQLSMPIEEGVCYKMRLGGSSGSEPSGELHINAHPFCGNGRINSDRSEQCDGGTGCLPDCTCGPGFEPSLFPSVNCVPLPDITLTASSPGCGVSLTRPANSVVRLTFSAPIPDPVTSTDLEIVEITDGGGMGADISGQFTYTVEGGNVLRIAENGTAAFTSGLWYAIKNTGNWTGVANFEVDYRVVHGDANNSGFTNFADLAAINANFVDPTTDSDLFDINASGFVNFADLASANSFNGDSAQDPAPTGHGCTIP